jgi:hypothetical protein
MLALDERIRPLYERGLGCRVIGQALGENPVLIFKRVRKMGILRSKEEISVQTIVQPTEEIPFSKSKNPKNLRFSAVSFVTHWFMERGYMVSIPIEPTTYDLVVESDEGLKKVQVKTTNFRYKGKWMVAINRRVYDSSAKPNAGGKTRKIAYSKKDADIIAAVTGEHNLYLIPIGKGLPKHLILDLKYKNFQIE